MITDKIRKGLRFKEAFENRDTMIISPRPPVNLIVKTFAEKGYQILPEAIDLLQQQFKEEDLDDIIGDIIDKLDNGSRNFIISSEDIQDFIALQNI